MRTKTSTENLGNLKVVFLLDSFGYPNGMASTQRVRLIANALTRSGCQVTVLCARALEDVRAPRNTSISGNQDGIRFEYTTGTTIRPSNFWVRRYIDTKGTVVALLRLAQMRFSRNVACIYYYGNILRFTFNRWVYYAAARLLGIPLITDISEPPWVINRSPNCFDNLLSPLASVKGVILISSALKEWVISESRQRQRNILTLHLPSLVDLREHHPPITMSEKKSLTVMFSGSPRYQATIEFIFASMEYVWKFYPECKLILTGFQPELAQLPWLNRLISKPFTQERVELRGFLPRSELLKLYCKVSVLLIPLFDDYRSIARFPAKLPEYLCSGTPVVTCEVGEVTHYLEDGVNAFICPPGDPAQFAKKIIEAIAPENAHQATQIGLNGLDVARKEFDIETHIETISQYFRLVCEK